MTKTLLLSSFSKALNAYLRLDAESAGRLQKLAGKTATIEWLPFHFVFQCRFTAQGVTLSLDEALPSDVKISGTPLQMMGMMMAKEDRARFFADELTMQGDAELGQQVTALFDEMQWDGEDYLSRLIGDVPAYHVGRVLKRTGAWLQGAKTSFMDNINEYVHEEKTWFPAREALNDFFADIDVLRMDVDRMEARIKELDIPIAHEATK